MKEETTLNRVIKFRAWDKNVPKNIGEKELNKPTGMMIDWDYIQKSSYIFELFEDHFPIMQFTGLTDKNGKEIYEGDIIKNTEHGFTFKVQWGIKGESYAGWAGNWNNRDFISPLFNGPLENCEVIGNIYEHPHLLTPLAL